MPSLKSIRQGVTTQLGVGFVTIYDSLGELPITNVNQGDGAYVKSNNNYYISDGIGWRNTGLQNKNPFFVTEPSDSDRTFVDSQTPITIIAKANDSDNPNLLNQSFATDSAQFLVDITIDSSVFTFTPKTKLQIAEAVSAGNLADSDGDFHYSFKFSDGISFVNQTVKFIYNSSPPLVGTNQYFGDRGFSIGGSKSTGNTQAIEYMDLTGNNYASTFGNLAGSGSGQRASVSDGNRIVTTGAGYTANNLNLEYFASATTGNATYSGNTLLGSAQGYCDFDQCAGSDGLYGMYVGGYAASGNGDRKAQTIVIQTAGDATNYNGLTNYERRNSTAVNNATRLVVIAGQFSTYTSPSRTMDYFTFQVQSGATDFGDISTQRHYSAEGNSNGTYGCFAGGITYHSGSDPGEHIQRITIATPGNASDIGDLGFNNASSGKMPTRNHGGCGNSTYGCTLGGGGDNYLGYGFQRSSWIHRWNNATGGNSVTNPPTLTAAITNASGASGNAS